MAIITISRGSYSKGREVAQKVAERLGYRVISRDVLLDASEKFGIPEIKLVSAIHDAPSILGRSATANNPIWPTSRAPWPTRPKKTTWLPRPGRAPAAQGRAPRGEGAHHRRPGGPGGREMDREKLSATEARAGCWPDDAERRQMDPSTLFGQDPRGWPWLYDPGVIHINGSIFGWTDRWVGNLHFVRGPHRALPSWFR